jgi:hypothetical protein
MGDVVKPTHVAKDAHSICRLQYDNLVVPAVVHSKTSDPRFTVFGLDSAFPELHQSAGTRQEFLVHVYFHAARDIGYPLQRRQIIICCILCNLGLFPLEPRGRPICKGYRRSETKWVTHARQQYTLLVPQRVGQMSKTRKHFLNSVIANVGSPMNARKCRILIH